MKKSILLFVFYILYCGAYAQHKATSMLPKDTALGTKVVQWMQNNRGLKFVENKGQMTDANGKADTNLLFEASAGGMNMYITTKGLSYVFTQTVSKLFKRNLHNQNLPASDNGIKNDSISTKCCRADMILTGAVIRKENIVKEYESKDRTDYYLGNLCPNGIMNVHSYRQITIKNIYPGIDWVIYTASAAKAAGKAGGLQYDFVVHPGADLSAIKVRYKWTDKPQLQSDGSLKICTPMGSIADGMPVSYMYRAVAGSDWNAANPDSVLSPETHYCIAPDSEISFKVIGYNKNKALIIDPPVVWATYYQDNAGGAGLEDVHGLADDSIDVWVTGETHTPVGFPTLNPGGGAYFQATLGGSGSINAFIMEFTVAGVLKWVTDYGGSAYDYGYSIFSDRTNVWVTGSTRSSNFPVANPEGATYYQSAYAGGTYKGDAFILQFSTAGVREWATYYGGSGDDQGNSIYSDGTYVWVTGQTNSTNFPVSNQEGANYYQTTVGGGNANNVFILQFTVAGVQEWATYYGGSGQDIGYSIQSDGTDVWITGQAESTNFPTLALTGAYNKSTIGGTFDAFILDFTTSGIRKWATYYGGTGTDIGYSISSEGKDIWVTGQAESTNFPTKNPGGSAFFQGTLAGTSNAFISKFNKAGALLWSTYYGGSGSDESFSIQSDKTNVWVCGSATSANFPTLNPGSGFFQGTLEGGTEEAFILQFDTAATRKWATYYGKDYEDDGSFIASDGTNVFVSGDAEPDLGPVAYDTVNPGGGAYYCDTAGALENVFIAKFLINAITDSIADSTNVPCFGSSTGIATVGVKGGTKPYTYLWSPNGGSGATDSGLSAGTYTVEVTDSNHITATAMVTITQPPAIAISISVLSEVSCNGGDNGSASSDVSGGTSPYTYLWTGGGSGSTISNLSAGTYTFEVTDKNGCEDSATINITQPAPIKDSIKGAVICAGDSATLTDASSGGTVPYSYLWSNGGTNNSIHVVPLVNSKYYITVTDSSGCVAKDSSTVKVNPLPDVSLFYQSLDTICQTNGVVLLFGNPTGGTFSGIGVTGNSFNPDSATAGKYELLYYIYTDSNGCTGTAKDSIFVQACSGINKLNNGNGGISIFPNPNNGIFTIQLPVVSNLSSVEIYNVLGEKVYSQVSTPIAIGVSLPFSINLSDQPSGVYLYRVLKKDGSLLGSGKVVIE